MERDERADAILQAFAEQRLIAPLTDADPALSVEDAYAIAGDAHAERVRRGEQSVGRKIGFTNRSIWREHKAPIWAYVYDSTLLDATDGAEIPVGSLLQPRIEPEIQLHFATAPPVTDDAAEILDCIDWIAHGFEIVQSPYPDWRFGTLDAVAACGLHALLVVGPPVPVGDVDDCAAKLASFTITMSRNGEAKTTGGGAAVLDSPLLAFAHLTRVLADQPGAEPVRAGEIVTTGTLTQALPAAPGETWSTELEGLELPGLSVTLV